MTDDRKNNSDTWPEHTLHPPGCKCRRCSIIRSRSPARTILGLKVPKVGWPRCIHDVKAAAPIYPCDACDKLEVQ